MPVCAGDCLGIWESASGGVKRARGEHGEYTRRSSRPNEQPVVAIVAVTSTTCHRLLWIHEDGDRRVFATLA